MLFGSEGYFYLLLLVRIASPKGMVVVIEPTFYSFPSPLPC